MVAAASFPQTSEVAEEAPRSASAAASLAHGAAVSLARGAPTPPAPRFVEAPEIGRALEEARADGFLTVAISAPKPTDRGHLALLVEEAVELELERCGGSPPGLLTEADLDASLADQLYRAKLLEFRGLAIALGPLSALADSSGVMNVEDSAVLRFLCDAPERHPVRLLFDSDNALVGVYGPPRALGELLPRSPRIEQNEVAPELDVTPDPAPAAASEPPLFAEEAPETSQIRPAPLGPLHERAHESWPAWLRDLEGARGPRPLASVERMFAKSYVPLRDACLRGIAPPKVFEVLEGWAASFAKSYGETFGALRVRTKRPTMVLDIPDVALRIGRLHGARSVQLLLVDGLRFDLGLRMEALLRQRLGQQAALAERLLLWSALPSDTRTQLELLGRGPDALRGLDHKGESDVTVARGRTARVPRRVKAGHRELLKLDLVEAELGEPGASEAERLDALAAPLTDAVAELCEKLPTRTLLVVFGDHGFVFETLADGTTVARQGGSRPEEVLVPAFAWLVGGVQ
jgi:hypothetical protein